ncbi:MAG: protein kinase domain-containing protein [Oscillochloridaceae bacterium umkhey_bin13]
MTELHLIGQTLGRFEVLAELGRGGMAVVYQARQTDLDRLVALKVLPPALTHDPSYLARFHHEARSVARLEHPHIMPIYEIGEAQGLHYIAMKLIQGQTVKDLLHAEGALDLARTVAILEQAGAALDYAHRQGVIHRDIKPSNMMITPEGWVYLTDFGLARGEGSPTGGLTLAGTVMGTPEYMSPEQAQGLASVGPPTDIYALGVVLYELLTGDFPFTADTPMGMLAARLLQAPIPPRDRRADLLPAVEDVIMRALARKPEARFASAAVLLEALRYAAGLPPTAPTRPVTPLAGMPAIDATIRVAGPATPAAAISPAQQAAPIPRQAMPAPTPVPPVTAPPTPPAPAKRSRAKPLVIGLAVIGSLSLLCILGLVVLVIIGVLSEYETLSPDPTVIADNYSQAMALGDEVLSEPDGIAVAITRYREALIARPDDPQALSRLAQASLAAGNWASASTSAEQLLALPALDPSMRGLAAAVLAEARLGQGNPNGARAVLVQHSPGSDPHALRLATEAHVRAVQALAIGDTNELQVALSWRDNALEQRDTLEENEDWLGLGLTNLALGETMALAGQLSADDDDVATSEAFFAEALEALPGAARIHVSLGQLAASTGDYALAREHYTTALLQDYPLAHAAIGWSYYAEGLTSEAEQAFATAITAAPMHGDGFFGQGRLRFEAGDYAGAVAHFTQATRLIGPINLTQAWLGEAHFWVGVSAGWPAGAQDLSRAETAFRAALVYDDRMTMAAAGLAWALQHQERYAESVAQFAEAIALDPHNASHYHGQGWSYFNQGQYREAEAALREALLRDPGYVEALYHLGRTLEAQGGRTTEARAAYAEALARNPQHVEAQAALARLGP